MCCGVATAYTISHDSKFYSITQETTTNENLTRKMRNESRFKDEGDTREQSPVIHENVKHEEDRTEDREKSYSHDIITKINEARSAVYAAEM